MYPREMETGSKERDGGEEGKSLAYERDSVPGERFCVIMNDFPVIGDPCFAHRILGSPGGKYCESLQRNVWCGAVSLLKAVSLDKECRILQ